MFLSLESRSQIRAIGPRPMEGLLAIGLCVVNLLLLAATGPSFSVAYMSTANSESRLLDYNYYRPTTTSRQVPIHQGPSLFKIYSSVVVLKTVGS
jgi:hypothetical protein